MRMSSGAAMVLGILVALFSAPSTFATKIEVMKPPVPVVAGERAERPSLNATRLEALGAKVIAEYPATVLVEVNDASRSQFLSAVEAEGLLARARESFDRIRINNYDFDSRGEPPALRSDLSLRDYHGSVGLYVVQLVGPPQADWYEGLLTVGEPLQYLADNTYIVRADPKAAQTLRARPYVQHLSVYQPAYKLRPDVLESKEPFQAIVQLDGGQDLDAIKAILEGIWSDDAQVSEFGRFGYADVILTSDDAVALAAMPEVLWIERNIDIRPSGERVAQAQAGNHTASQPTGQAQYQSWLESVNWHNGKSFCTSVKRSNCWDYWTKVAVFDSGLDYNICASSPSDGTNCSTADRHPDFNRYTTGTREKGFYCAGPLSGDNYCKVSGAVPARWDYSDTLYHGTGVASVIASDPLVTGGRGLNARDRYSTGSAPYSGFYLGTGIAPLAEILSFKIFDGIGHTFADQSTIFTRFYTPGQWEAWYGQLPAYPSTRFANNSWNMYDSTSTNYDTVYNLHSQMFDMLVRDANGGFNDLGHPMTIVFSAGNVGSGNPYGYVLAPANAKNVITVGASENWRLADIEPWATACTFAALDIRNIPSPSARGVDRDYNRYKPDFVAAGTKVGVAFTRAPYDTGASRGCAQPPPPPEDPEEEEENGEYYTRADGTSFSAPAVTGAAVLADAFYYYKKGSIPSPAMIKAMLAATAEDLAGGSDKRSYPPTEITAWPAKVTGWGRVNLGRLLQATVPIVTYDEDHRTSGEQRRFTTGEGSWSVPLVRQSSDKDVIVAMVFTDAPAASQAYALRVNNLDLYVLSGQTVFQGNYFRSCTPPHPNPLCGYTYPSVGGGWPDLDNNVELVRIRPADMPSNYFTIEIVPGVVANAVPSLDGNAPNQDFALYVYNATTY